MPRPFHLFSFSVLVSNAAPDLVIFRSQVEQMFFHGFDNYMNLAFPEDELRPLTCGFLTRDREHPEKIDINDVLGNYSLTLIDSLSTLAILASSEETGERPWKRFQDGVRDLVRLYGDGSRGPAGQGERERGFDVDSKVQVFETVIRGLGKTTSTTQSLCRHWNVRSGDLMEISL